MHWPTLGNLSQLADRRKSRLQIAPDTVVRPNGHDRHVGGRRYLFERAAMDEISNGFAAGQ